ncbi:EAL domain-containing response regulator [Vibrio sp. JPW-9-11-11]|uniref:EAL domain-containing response regulator n=1 Tax=Vibrio sp. JPW-9-11-11 TaxID=1416532 RepID=UPI0034E8F3D6
MKITDDDKLIMIVDDQHVVRQALKLCIQNLKLLRVLEAENGKDAKALVDEHEIDIIFCDLNMPVEDGLEVLRYLGDLKFKGSVILISGEEEDILTSSSNLAQLYKLDILGSLKKPITFPVVKALFEQLEQSAISRINNAPPPVLSRASIEHYIENGSLIPYFQPQIDLSTSQISGLEVLARILNEDGKLIPPDSFIPVAEADYELIQLLTKTIICEAFSDFVRYRNHLTGVNIAINISAKVLEDSAFPRWLNQTAIEYHIPQDQITCELTETALTHDQTIIDTQLLRLKMLKFKLSIDDFGTGYSSIAQLHSIPFDELKVDKRFVSDCVENNRSRAILEQSIRMAKAMGMVVVAEGVETRNVESLLRSMECDATQGYLYSRPDQLSHIVRYIQHSNSTKQGRE